MGIDPISLAITVALNAAAMAITASRTIEGPRLTDLNATVADYGTPLSSFMGVRRLNGVVFYAEPITETKTRNKTKGGKYNEYKYSGTFAVLAADHEINSYRKLWLDNHLVYDTTGLGTEETLNVTDYIRFYYGTEDQEADERMVATVEGEEGPGTCPAYLGVAYAFFEDLPLEKFGNRFPQVGFELQSGGDWIETGYVTGEAHTVTVVPNHNFNITFAPDWSAAAWTDSTGATLQTADVPTRTIGASELFYGFNTGATFSMTHLGGYFYPAGYIVRSTDGSTPVVSVRDLSLSLIPGSWVDGPGWNVHSASARYTSDGRMYYGSHPWSFHQLFVFDISMNGNLVRDGTAPLWNPLGPNLYNMGWQPSSYFPTIDGQVMAVGREVAAGSSTDKLYFMYLPMGSGVLVESGDSYIIMPTAQGPGSNSDTNINGMMNPDGNLLITWSSQLYIIDMETYSLIGPTATLTDWRTDERSVWSTFEPGQRTIWLGSTEYDTTTGTAIRTIAGIPTNIHNSVYDQENRAILTWDGSTTFTWWFFEEFTPTIRLRDICNRISETVELDSDDYDFEELDQIIEGYSWSQSAAKDIISPLLDLHDCDVRPNGFVIEGIKRGNLADGDDIDFGWFRAGDSETPSHKITVASESDLPRRIFATFADMAADQQPNTAVAQRSASSVMTRREMSFDLTTLASSVDTMQGLVERVLRRGWVGSTRLENGLTPKELRLLPGSVRNFTLPDDTSFRGRLIRMSILPNRSLDTVWEQEFAAVNTERPAIGAPATGQPPDTVFNPVDSVIFIMDIPLLSDSHDQTTPFLYVGGAPVVSPGDWPGTDIAMSDSGTVDTYATGWDGIASGQDAIWGQLYSDIEIPLTSVVDWGNDVVIEVVNGNLESRTEDEILENQLVNQFAIGAPGRWVIGQFCEATLQSDGEYILRGIVWGARGTEVNVPLIVAGDRFVLTQAAFKIHDMGIGKVGDADFYEGVTLGRSDTAETPTEVLFTGAANKPLSPVHIELVPSGADWLITWVRRSRIGGSNLDGSDIPLGETSEAYKVRILDPYTGDAVRTIEATEEAATWTGVQQVEDFGESRSGLWVEIVQMSPTLGLEGYPAEAVV